MKEMHSWQPTQWFLFNVTVMISISENITRYFQVPLYYKCVYLGWRNITKGFTYIP